MMLLSNTSQAMNSSWGDSTEDYAKPAPLSVNSVPTQSECKENACCLGGSGKSGGLGGKTGSPVYLQTGNFTWSDVDSALVGKPNLLLSRSYTAFDPHSGLFGNSWISNFEKLFLKTIKYSKEIDAQTHEEKTVYIFRQTDGTRFHYAYDENNNSFIDLGNLRLKAHKIDDDTVTLTYPSGTKET
jgi:hypothetical protein